MKYRYRIPFGEKFKMTTKIVYVDDKWTYFYISLLLKIELLLLLVRTGSSKIVN